MDAVAMVALIDKAITLITGVLNVFGASKIVSDIIAKRISENRDWTDAERQAVLADLSANKAYAAQQLGIAPPAAPAAPAAPATPAAP